MVEPLFRKVDCVLVRVPELEAGLKFYRDGLGHRLIWRTEMAAGLAMPESDAELVLHTAAGPEVDLLVADLDQALRQFLAAGGELVSGPFDVPVGRGAVVRDPFGHVLVLLDQSKGSLVMDADGNVVGNRRGS